MKKVTEITIERRGDNISFQGDVSDTNALKDLLQDSLKNLSNPAKETYGNEIVH